MRLEYPMQWTEFVTQWAKKDLKIESLQLGEPLTNDQINTILASFPDTERLLQHREVANLLRISESTVKARFTCVYQKCGLSNNSSKDKARAKKNPPELKPELRKRLIAEFKQLSPEEPAKSTQPTADKPTPQIDWLQISHDFLSQQKNLTTNPLQLGATRNLDDVHVPLGLMERKERPQVKQEPSPEMGSQLLQPIELTETRRFEHEDFLAEVVGKRTANSKHIAIIGEPGAGKTTLLTRIGEWLLNPASQSETAVVVWVSLAAVGSRRLEDYLKEEWLRQVWDGDDVATPWESFKQMRQQGRVWLLLDGLDEMSGDAVRAIQGDLSEAWARNLRVVVTCRLNQWDGVNNSLVNSFEVYRTLDYEYRTATGEDRVLEFLTKWFENPDTAQHIRTSLDDAGKERIKDLVKNPLRLTLFCASWAENQALPETQAELYRRFVNYLYRWKAQEFQTEVSLRQQLDPALGKLAIAGLNRQPNRDGAVRRFRFTEPEIAKLWQDLPPTLLPAAKKLGWLNAVGTEAGANIYAFFHPTFQEYFAACSIDDWDYFLPRAHVDRPVPCMGEREPTYRVFEKEWQQTILLWIGRGDVGDELKEEFIEKLTNFEEQEEAFYYYRIYCMAGICVGEFKSSRQAQEIVEQVFEWAFGCFDDEQEQWVTFLDDIKFLAREIIPLTNHREYAINALFQLLAREDLSDDLRSSVKEALGKIAVGNERAITALVKLLAREDLDINFHHRVEVALSQIAVGNKRAIAALVQLLLAREDLDDSHRYMVEVALGQIAVGNERAIFALTQLLAREDLDDSHRYSVAYALGLIGVENERAIDTLAQLLLAREDLDDSLSYRMVDALGEIAVGNEGAIAALAQLLARDDLDDFYRNRMVDALGLIGVGNELAIDTLVKLLARDDLNRHPRYSVADKLGEIAVGNEGAIAALVKLLARDDLDDYVRYRVAMALGEIAVGNEGAIAALIKLLAREDLDDYYGSRIAEALGLIGVGNEGAIDALVQLLAREDLDDDLRSSVAYALGKIAVGDESAIDALVQLLAREDLDNDLRSSVALKLHRIATKPMMPSVVSKLKSYVTTEVRESNIEKFKFCHRIIFDCAFTLPYPTFHAAWHQTHLPVIPHTHTHILTQLNRPHTILLDITPLSSPTSTEIPQTLTNLIYSELDIQPIPLVTTTSQLQAHLLNLKLAPHLVVISHHSTPAPTDSLVRAIDLLQVPRQIQILWISNSMTIPDAISPDSSDLVAAIESAIDRFTES